MRSDVPKVLHRVCGKPMLDWVVDAGREAGARRIVCVVRPGDGVAEGLPEGVELAEQTDGEGTGAAVLAARDHLEDGAGAVVILSGDHPLVSAEHLTGLLGSHNDEGATATVLTTENLDPAGYGRIVRDGDGSVTRIVETKNPDGVPAEELAIREVNLGTYAFDPVALLSALDVVAAQGGERYLTGAIQVMRDRGEHIATHLTHDAERRPRRQRPRRPDAGRGGGPDAHPRGPGPRGGHLPPARHHPRGGRRLDRRGHGDRAGREPRGPDGRGRGGGDRAAHHGHRLPYRRREQGGALLSGRGGRGRERQRGSLRLPAPGHRPARGSEGRHLRGGQELGCGRGGQGAPPVLHRGRRRGRGQQPRRQHDHRQLRRPPEAPDAASARGSRRASTPRSWPPSTSGTARTLVPVR